MPPADRFEGLRKLAKRITRNTSLGEAVGSILSMSPLSSFEVVHAVHGVGGSF